MNYGALKMVLMDIDDIYKKCDKLRFVYKLNGNYLWIYDGNNIIKGVKNFSLRNLDKLIKFIKKNRIEFNEFDIQY